MYAKNLNKPTTNSNV